MSKELSTEKSLKIADKLLNIFTIYSTKVNSFFLCYPFSYYSNEYDDEMAEGTRYATFYFDTSEDHYVKKIHAVTDEEDLFRHNSFTIMDNGTKYKILIFDSPDICGYGTGLPNYDSETYLLCEISEYDGERVKFRMYFGFDVLNMTFLELFNIDYINKNNFHRECYTINKIEKELNGRKLISVPINSQVTEE